MKGAMVALAEYVLDGEVVFGAGTSCFVVERRNRNKRIGQNYEVEDEGEEPVDVNVDRDGGHGKKGSKKGGKGKGKEKEEEGERKGRSINKARIIDRKSVV